MKGFVGAGSPVTERSTYHASKELVTPNVDVDLSRQNETDTAVTAFIVPCYVFRRETLAQSATAAVAAFAKVPTVMHINERRD